MVSAEMDLKPFMNLMVVLIPMLLLSAEFAKVAIIDINLPKGGGANDSNTQKTRNSEEDKNLKLTAILTHSVVTLAARGGFLPSIHYREFHTYVAKDDQTRFTEEYVPGKKVHHPVSGREMLPQERDEIRLEVCDDNNVVQQKLYSGYGELVTDADGNALGKVSAGDTVQLGMYPGRTVVVKDPSVYSLRPLSVYDELKNRLVKIKNRYRDANDANTIIIAAENNIIYDKIVQVMDKAREADFADINISKLRG